MRNEKTSLSDDEKKLLQKVQLQGLLLFINVSGGLSIAAFAGGELFNQFDLGYETAIALLVLVILLDLPTFINYKKLVEELAKKDGNSSNT